MIALDFGQSEKVDLTPIYNSLSYHQYEINLLKSKPPKNVSFSLDVAESILMDGYHFCNKEMYGYYKTDTMIPFPDFEKPYVWNHQGLGVYISQLHQGYYYDIFAFCAGAIEAGAMNMGVNNYLQISLAKDVNSSFPGNEFTFITYPSMKRRNEAFLNGTESFHSGYIYPRDEHLTTYTVSNTFTMNDTYLYSKTFSFSIGDVSVFSSRTLPNYSKCSYYYYVAETQFTPGS